MRRLLVLLLTVASLGLVSRGVVPCDALSYQPRCFVALHPGPTEDTLGIVQFDGETTYPSEGQLLLTTVGVDPDLDLLEWIRGQLDPRVDEVARELIYPPGSDDDEVQEQNAAQMAGSQLDAVLAALQYLGRSAELIRVGSRVVSTTPGLPSAEVLEPGDILTAVDGRAIVQTQEAIDIVQERAVGDVISLTFQRDGTTLTDDVELVANPDGSGRPIVGVTLQDEVELPVDITIDAGPIGGPSAGLMFTLAVIDLLTPEDLTGGRVIAGTGTIAPTGVIGPIGGIQQKILGSLSRRGEDGARLPAATVFLTPSDNVAEARSLRLDGEDILVVPVTTLADAVSALEALREGRQPTGAFALGATRR